MRAFVEWATHHTWGGLLWLNRRPWMRIARKRAAGYKGRPGYEKARARIMAQERFALKHGRNVIRAVFWLLLISFAFQAATWAILQADQRGWLPLPRPGESTLPD